jgi:hypothetical protein
MQKPNNYENTDAFTGEGQRLTVGGKICTIVNAYETTTKKTNQPMLVLEFDIAEGEEKGFYEAAQQQYGGDWRGVYRQGTLDKDGNCSPFFKGMISAIEESNDRYKFDFNEKTLIGKKFGGVFGEEEYIGKDGTVKTAVKLMQIRSTDAIRKGNFKIPPKKTVSGTTQPAVDNGFTSVESENIPF